MKITIEKTGNLLSVNLAAQNHEDRQGIHLIVNAMNPGGEPAGPEIHSVDLPVAGVFVDKDKNGLAGPETEKNEGGGNSGQSENGQAGQTNN